MLTAVIHLCSDLYFFLLLILFLGVSKTSFLIVICASSIGSYKEHERSGCKFCESTRYCKPSDSKYCCPCEWHQLEQVKQASAVEDNIRK